MGSDSWRILLLVALVAVAADAESLYKLHDSSNSNQGNPTQASNNEKGGEHHSKVVVTGVEVGVATVSPSPAAAATVGSEAEEPAPNLLGDLISAASGESNGTLGQVLDKALAKEFEQESKNAESGKGKTFNETVAQEEVSVPLSGECPRLEGCRAIRHTCRLASRVGTAHKVWNCMPHAGSPSARGHCSSVQTS